jgi:hypothetical protein
MEEQAKERPTIPQEEAVKTQAAMDFQSTVLAVFHSRTQVAIV